MFPGFPVPETARHAPLRVVVSQLTKIIGPVSQSVINNIIM